jgi:hypothetical protein
MEGIDQTHQHPYRSGEQVLGLSAAVDVALGESGKAGEFEAVGCA